MKNPTDEIQRVRDWSAGIPQIAAHVSAMTDQQVLLFYQRFLEAGATRGTDDSKPLEEQLTKQDLEDCLLAAVRSVLYE